MKEIFPAPAQSADTIGGVGRALTLLDGSVRVFTADDYVPADRAKTGQVSREWTETGWKFFQH